MNLNFYFTKSRVLLMSILVFALGVLTLRCSKEETKDPVITPAEAIKKEWVLSALRENGTQVSIRPCEDKILQFSDGNTVTVKDKAVKCEPNHPSLVGGTYELANSSLTISTTEPLVINQVNMNRYIFSVTELTPTSLKLRMVVSITGSTSSDQYDLEFIPK